EPFLAPQTTTVAERLASVTSRSSRRPAASVRGSTRVAVSGGTSVSWGETEVGPAPAQQPTPPPASRTRLYGAIGVAPAPRVGVAVGQPRAPHVDLPPASPEHAPPETNAATAAAPAEIPSVRKDDTPPDAAALAQDRPTPTPSVRKIYPRPAPPPAATTA